MTSVRGRRWRFYVAIVGCLGLLGCGSARRGAPVQSPLDTSEPAIARGEEVFMRYCNACHPGGEAGLGPALNNKPLPAFLIRFQVRHGLGVMPAFADQVISAEQLDALTAYLIRLRHHD